MKRQNLIAATIALIIGLTFLFAGVANAQRVITLSWDAPTTNSNGTPLTDLAGFKVYHKLTAGAYNATDMVDVGNVLTTDKTLPAGDYCFVATAYDTSGNESTYSNEVCDDIPSTFQLRITIN